MAIFKPIGQLLNNTLESTGKTVDNGLVIVVSTTGAISNMAQELSTDAIADLSISQDNAKMNIINSRVKFAEFISDKKETLAKAGYSDAEIADILNITL